MSNICSDRRADLDAQPTRSTLPAGARYTILALISVSVSVWICNRNWNQPSAGVVSPERIRDVVVRAGLRPLGSFREQITGVEGVEIDRPDCARPTALLAVDIRNAEVAPGDLTYGDGSYRVSYSFDGNIYSPPGISYKLGIVAVLHRIRSLAAGADPRVLAYYYKIWTPGHCAQLSRIEIERLHDAD